MKNIILVLLFLLSCLHAQAQENAFFTADEATEWVPYLIGYNIEVLGEQNEKGIAASDTDKVEFLFASDTREKVESLKKALRDTAGCRLYKEFSVEGLWLLTGVTDQISMEFASFADWTLDFCKAGLRHDCKMLSWNVLDSDKAKKVDDFWKWFESNQNEFFKLDFEDENAVESAFEKLSQEMKSFNESIVFEFSPVLDNGKREFVLSADGLKTVFPDLLDLFKRSPELEKWEIIPFRQAFQSDPGLEFADGFKLSWDKVMFQYKPTPEGLSIDFYIEDYHRGNKNFGIGLVVLLDSYLGEYDAVMQIRFVNTHALDRFNSSHLKEFKELKQVVEEFKTSKK